MTAALQIMYLPFELIGKGLRFLSLSSAIGNDIAIIGRYEQKRSNSIFNSAVVPFEDGYVGVFRCDSRSISMDIFVGRSKDGIHWEIEDEPIKFEGADEEILTREYRYDPRVCKIDDKYYVTWCNGYQQPSLICLDRNRAGTDLGALPCRLVAAYRTHHMTVSSPELHILTLADEDISKWCVAVVARTAHHHIVAVDFSREQHAVTVEWKECVLKLNEFLEVIGVSNTDGRAVIAVAPGYIVFVVDFADTRVITVLSCQPE